MAVALVTGGAGFIGSHLVASLLEDGYDVTVLDDLSTGRRENLSSAARLVVGSVLDNQTLHSLLEAADEIYHLAAIASVQRCSEYYAASHSVNAGAAVKILDFLKSTPEKRFVYASSAAVYGALEDMPATEYSSTRPLSVYGADKLTVEIHASAAFATYGIGSVGLRFFNVYGPRQDPSSPYSGVISQFAHRISRGQIVEVHGDGRQSRDFVYVDDVVRALRLAARASRGKASVYNVCTGRDVTVLELIEILGHVFSVIPATVFMPARLGDIRISAGSPERAAAELDFKATTQLVDGLTRYAQTLKPRSAAD
jgi:UDP-glucose 4-epimerase